MEKITRNVEGAPFKIGDVVQVVRAADHQMNGDYLGKVGKVSGFDYGTQLEDSTYQSTCGQSYPADPMIFIEFGEPSTETFWRDELLHLEGAMLGITKRSNKVIFGYTHHSNKEEI